MNSKTRNVQQLVERNGKTLCYRLESTCMGARRSLYQIPFDTMKSSLSFCALGCSHNHL